ncbi:MAG: ABC transporter substrate-binding protein [Lunatimonas sp.]|uniref:heme/hemin ABC transporter substrate-binding protein n=1 Tax=Lunatimonas sp. TaxID=2060141 RepID=UPI00263A8F96|nr:ABC transporter substrate-binding protein [Lunatimonas sp.]MCC5936863.1 ABC transporter substrate-binding protein [Lunatimonas sp.]
MKPTLLIYLLISVLACTSPATEKQSTEQKLITAGGTITEIVAELGFGASIIATDITSTYPISMQQLPSIGYRNQIKAEGILALAPDQLLTEKGYLSEEAITQLRQTGLEIHEFEKPKDLEGTYRIIEELATFLNVPEKGAKVRDQLRKDIRELEEYLSTVDRAPKAAFVMARGTETVFVAGEDTFAESLFRLAGIQSVGRGFKEFIPLTPEALISMNPDYLLFFESGLQTLGGKEGVRQIRGIEQTNAFKNEGILAFDGLYLSGFGPRVGKAALELAKAVKN